MNHETRLARLEQSYHNAMVTEGLRRVEARLAAGDPAMTAAVEQAVSAATEAEGLIAVDAVLGLLDAEDRDPVVKEHLKGMIDKVRAMTDDELLDFLGQRGRR